MRRVLINISCPKCRDGTLTIDYDPGDPGVHNFGDGSGEPPTPDSIEGLEANCACWPETLVDEMFSESCTWCHLSEDKHGPDNICTPEWANLRIYNDNGVEVERIQHHWAPDNHQLYNAVEEIVQGYVELAGYFEAIEFERVYGGPC